MAKIKLYDTEAIRNDYAGRLFEREQNIDRYQTELTDADFRILNEVYDGVETNNEEYANNRYRAASALKFARMYGLSDEEAFNNIDDFVKYQYPHVTSPKAAWRAISDSIALGVNQVKVSDMGLQLMSLGEGEDWDKLWAEIKAVEKENEGLGDGVNRGMFLEGVKYFGQSWLFTASSAAAGALGSLGTPALGIASAAAVSASQMAGLEYVNMLNEGIDKDTALRLAWASGGIQGVIEAGLGDVAALGSRTGIGQKLSQIVFKKLHYSGAFGAIGRALAARPVDSLMEGLEEAAQELASQAFMELAKTETEKKTGVILGRDTLEEKRRAIIESFKGGFFTSFVLGFPIAGKDIVHNLGDLARADIARNVAPDFETYKKAMDETDNAAFRGLEGETREEVMREVYSVSQQRREIEEREIAERNRKERLYGTVELTDKEGNTTFANLENTSGKIYRNEDGTLYTRNRTQEDSNGITEGSYRAGIPGRAEESTYAEIKYEIKDNRISVEGVYLAENAEGIKDEVLQKFSNDLGQEVSWKGQTFTPVQADTITAANAGTGAGNVSVTPGTISSTAVNANKAPANVSTEAGNVSAKAGNVNEIPADASGAAANANETAVNVNGSETAPPELTRAERTLDDGLKRVMPNLTDAERRANIELVKLHADYKNLSLDDYLGRYFRDGVFTGLDANQAAAAQDHAGRVNGAVMFDPDTGKALIAGSTWANASTAAHEFLHAFSRSLEDEDLAEYRNLFKDDEEAAQSYEKYLETGEAPTEKLKGLFEKIKEFMRKVYALVKNGHNLTEEQRAFWDGIFRKAEMNREINRKIDALNEDARKQAGEAAGIPNAGTQGTAGQSGGGDTGKAAITLGVPPEQARIRALDKVIADTGASFAERSDAAVEKAGIAYEEAIWQDSGGPGNITQEEKRKRVDAVMNSEPIVVDTSKIAVSEDLKQFKKNAFNYGKTLVGEYTNKSDNTPIELTARNKHGGLTEILSHDRHDKYHLQSIAAIPDIATNAQFITRRNNEDIAKHPGISEYRYYLSKISVDSEEFLVKSLVSIANDGKRYYDHRLTELEKIKGLLTSSVMQKQTESEINPYKIYDKRLVEILQEVFAENSEILFQDDNDEFEAMSEKEDRRILYSELKKNRRVISYILWSESWQQFRDKVNKARGGKGIQEFLSFAEDLNEKYDDAFDLRDDWIYQYLFEAAQQIDKGRKKPIKTDAAKGEATKADAAQSKVEQPFQDDTFTAFLNQNPSLIAYAAGFDSAQEFQDAVNDGWLNADKGARALVPESADNAWYRSVWESARKITEDRRRDKTTDDAGADTVTEKNALQHFLDFIKTDEGLDEIFTYIDAANDPAFQAIDEEDLRVHEAEKRAADNVFRNSLWRNKESRKAKEFRASMRGMIRENPVPYMNAYAVLSGNDVYLAGDDQADTLVSLAPEREDEIRRSGPEELKRIAREISWKDVDKEIEKGTLRGSDPRIPEFEEENKRKIKAVREKIAIKIDKITDYEDWIKWIQSSIETQEAVQRFKSTREGITLTKKDLRKLRDLQRLEHKARLEYGKFLSTLNPAMKQQFLGLRDLYGELAHTEKALVAIERLRAVRKKAIKGVARRPDLKTVNLEQAQLIEGIQSYFDKWYSIIPKWIGPKAKNLRQLYSDFALNEDYREKLRRKLIPEHYRQLERIMYADSEKKTIKPYTDLTPAQRNKAYSLLVENEALFTELGLDNIDVPSPKPSAETYEKLKEILPADLLYKLEKVSLAEWTLEDMESLGSIISRLKEEGRTELKAKNDARREITNRYRDLFDRSITGGKDLGAGQLKGVQSTEARDKKREGRKALLYSLMNARRFFRMLDGGKDRAFYEIVFQGEDQAYTNMTRSVVKRREQVDQALKEAKIDIRDLWRTTFDVEFGDSTTRVTLDEMLYFRRAGLNDRAWQAVVYGNFAGSDERAALSKSTDLEDFLSFDQKAQTRYNKAMAQLEDFLNKKENEKFRKVEEIIGADYDGNYGRLKAFAAREFNQDLGSEENYLPIKRLEATGEANEQENIKDVLSSAGFGSVAKVGDGFTISRKDIAPQDQKPTMTGLYKSWDGMVEKQERLMAYGPYVRMLRRIFEGDDAGNMRSHIKTKYTGAANDYIDKFIAYVANPQPMKEYDAMDAMTRLLRGNYPTAVLGWRLSSVIKQAITSPPPFFQYVSIPEYAAASARIIGDYKTTMAMIREKSVYMKERVYDPSIEMVNMIEKAALEGKLGQAEALLNRFNKLGMKGLEIIDLACVAPGWLAAYNKKLAELAKTSGGMTEALQDAEAVRYADQVVRDTQPSSRGVDLAPLFRDKKGIMKAFLQFQVPMSVIFQNLAFDVPTAIKNGQVHQLFVTVAIYALTAVAIGAMQDDDDEFTGRDAAASAAGGLIDSIPVFGNAASRMVESMIRGEKVRPTQWNIFPILQSIEKGANAIQNQNLGRAADTVVDAMFYMTGLPAGLKNEFEKAAESGDPGVFFGVK